MIAFAVLQVIEPIMHGLRWPDVMLSYVVVALALGFPAVALLAWAFDLRDGRLERTPPSEGAFRLRGARLALVLVGLGVLCAAPGLGWYLLRGRGAAAGDPQAPVALSAARTAAGAASSAQRWLVPVGSSPARGPADALVTIVEFADFQCPYTKLAEPVLRRLEARFPNKLRVVWKDYPSSAHSEADPAAQLAQEALRQQGVEGFWRTHDRLLERSPGLGKDALEAVAGELGLELGEVRQALTTERHRRAIDADVEALARIGAAGTPTFLVNGHLVDGEGEEVLTEAVAQALEEARRALASSPPGDRPYDLLQRGARQAGGPRRRVSLPDPGHRPARGGPAARAVTIHEFCDLSLPRCAWIEPSLRALLRSYGDEVRLVWWDVGNPQRPEALRARRAALAADARPGGFWAMHDAILDDLRTDDFRPPPPERLQLPALREHARRMGVDLATFDYALAADEGATTDLAEVEAARRIGLGPTTLVIDGEVYGGFEPQHLLRQAVDGALARRR